MRGQYDKAIEISRRGLQNVHENGSGFYNNIGQFCLGLRKYDEATEAFSKAVERAATPVDRARGYHNMAITGLYKVNELKADDTQEKDRLRGMAEEALLKSIELDGSYLPSWDSYINVTIDRGKQEILRGQLQQQVQKTQDPKAYYGLGKLAFQQGNFREAADYFRQAAAQYKNEKMFWFNSAYALEGAGDGDSAIDKYVEALRLDPQFLEGNYNLAQLYMEKGRYESAIQHFDRVLRIDPGNTTVHLQLARIYIKQGQRGLARNHLTAVLNVSPGNPEATALWQQTL
jgi:tetratricopeptide (TPR) repeat protein